MLQQQTEEGKGRAWWRARWGRLTHRGEGGGVGKGDGDGGGGDGESVPSHAPSVTSLQHIRSAKHWLSYVTPGSYTSPSVFAVQHTGNHSFVQNWSGSATQGLGGGDGAESDTSCGGDAGGLA